MKTTTRFSALAGLALFAASLPAGADESRQQLLEMKNTVENLVDALVEQGVIEEGQAEAIKRQARAKATVEARQELAAEREADKKLVRVPYIPEFVREEIKKEVREELKDDVLADVSVKAREERWGTPDALPSWVNRFKWYGDFRVRYDFNRFDDENVGPYLNVQNINDAQGVLSQQDSLNNFFESRSRMRMRLRFGFEAMVAKDLDVITRIATSSSPVSRNVDLGNDLDNFNMTLERAYIRYAPSFGEWGDLTVLAGKYETPFHKTELVWDNDVNLTGLTLMYGRDFALNDGDPALVTERKNRLFAAFGIYALDLDELGIDDGRSNDKYIFGAQLGFERRVTELVDVKFSTALYDYHNTTGEFDPTPGSTVTLFTAPGFAQKGNATGFLTTTAPTALGLVTDYTLLSFVANSRLYHFDPIVVDLTAAYVRNLGYSANDLINFQGTRNYSLTELDSRNEGFELSAYAGHPEVSGFGTWRVGGRYVYLQADATFDAFANSNFQLGGTNYAGWQADLWMGVTENSYARLRYFSTNEVTGQPLGIDVLLLDYQTEF